MSSWYIINHNSLDRDISEILSEIETINPDYIILLCLEEFDYSSIFQKLFDPLHELLEKLNKIAKLIVPFVDITFDTPKNIIVEESYGYYHWTLSIVEEGIKNPFKIIPNYKLFTNYNNNGKYQRGMLVDELAKHDLLKDGIVTLIQPEMRLPNGNFYEYKYHNGLPLLDEPDFVLNSKREYNAGSMPKSYLNGMIDIVAESTYEERQFFITEKTAKAIGALKPFMILGSRNVHKYLLEKYNIELYPEFFDYSFDDCTNIEDRIEGIIQNLLTLRKLPTTELNSKYLTIIDKLKNNRTNYASIIKDMDKFLPKSLLPLYYDKQAKIYSTKDVGIFQNGIF